MMRNFSIHRHWRSGLEGCDTSKSYQDSGALLPSTFLSGKTCDHFLFAAVQVR